jgi:hypothetical protein
MGAVRLLSLYGLVLVAPAEELTEIILQLDSKAISEDDFSGWLDAHCIPTEEDAPPA